MKTKQDVKGCHAFVVVIFIFQGLIITKRKDDEKKK